MNDNNIDGILKADFLREVLNILHHQHPNETYVKHILAEAKALSCGDKDYYQIDWSYFPLIVKVSHLDKPWLRELDLDSLVDEDYENLYDLLKNCVH
jgi:hypothetical protein